MDHFPMLCRILKYVSFSGPFPWHSNKCAVHRLTTKVYTKPCISISTPRREPTRYWFANIVQWPWVVVGQPASQPHLKFSKKCSFHPEILLSRRWQTCWLNDLGSRFDPPYDPIRSDRIKFGYLITFIFHQQKGDWWSLVSSTYFRFFTLSKNLQWESVGNFFQKNICRERCLSRTRGCWRGSSPAPTTRLRSSTGEMYQLLQQERQLEAQTRWELLKCAF